MKKLFIYSIFVLCISCTGRISEENNKEQRVRQVDSIVYGNRSIDSLLVVLDRFEKEENEYGVVVSCRELGRSYRNASKFSEAIDVHKKGLCAARQICDTIQIIQALNNLGTDPSAALFSGSAALATLWPPPPLFSVCSAAAALF